MSWLSSRWGIGLVVLVTGLSVGGSACSSSSAASIDARGGTGGVGSDGSSEGLDGSHPGDDVVAATGSACTNRTRQVPLSATFVADFEDVSGEFLSWYSFRDPTPDAVFNMMEVQAPGALGTRRAAHLSGSGFKSFGAGMGYGFGCSDVSAFDGVSFWARGNSGIDNTIAFQAVLPETHAVADNGDCLAKCYDHPSAEVVIGPEWKQYALRFSDLHQAGFGGPATYKGIIMALSWVSTAGPNVDFWIDEIAYYKGAADVRPVGAGPPSEAPADAAADGSNESAASR